MELLLDANLAVLFVVGRTDRAYIEKHKRLSAFDARDFDIVCTILGRFDSIIFTPNVLSETSNLIRYVNEPIRSRISTVFAGLVRLVDERFVESKVAVERTEHVRLGLTDAVLLTLAARGAALLTVDLDLYLAALRAGLQATNYNHVRDALRDDYR